MSNPTANFNWQMPTATDLVTDLPADFEVFGQAVDTALMDLKGGTTGQVLKKNSGTDMDFVWGADGSGAVVQVKSATYSTATSTTSTTYVASGLSLSITPTSASNKILCFVNVSGITARSGNDSGYFMRLRRAGTAILDDGDYVTYILANGVASTQLGMPITRVFLDSPATTSATTYDVQISSDGGGSATVTAQWNSNTSTITLMEVTP
jgi:hypothetical protein